MRFNRINLPGMLVICLLALSSCTTTHHGIKPSQPLPHTAPPIEPVRGALTHSVAPGETLWRIAKMYDVDVETIKKSNNIKDVTDLEIGTRLYIPGATPRKRIVTLYPSKKWKYIIVHHSASDRGSATEFNKAHINRGWSGVGYHFVIDNGTCGKDDGQIESTPRWTKQLDGAHCKAGGMNYNGIGICLVGNFSEPTGTVTSRQMNSLVFLVNALSNYYNIPTSHIMGHGQVPGAKTECPGTKFPWAEFWSKAKLK
ncbi:MAG: N-acetylmuramoyl-L-alanine amidase [Candidatus Omnitrophota bacterium]